MDLHAGKMQNKILKQSLRKKGEKKEKSRKERQEGKRYSEVLQGKHTTFVCRYLSTKYAYL